MSLYTEWKDLLENQTDDTFEAFWDEYCKAEMAIYTHILEHKDEHLKGTVKDLAEKFGCRTAIFEGFLDGVETSLNGTIDLEAVTEDTEVDLDVDLEKLYYNMHKADAPHLYGLDAWENALPEDRRSTIEREYKKSKIYHAPKKIGRNEPCPCGSGKKYKNCCGRN